MIDVSEIDKLKKKLTELRSQKNALDIDIAKKEALVADTKEKLSMEFQVSTVEEASNSLQVLNSKAESLKQDINTLLSRAREILAGVGG